ncbi:DUF2306 domain-containing protein [Lysinibacillus sp. NPDC058147]|uniref:DUF2306 domain-containing protein n=1 Tax=unclassified Lysinibacillus TaxID=2636778 RepID=UPI0036DCB855
MRKILIGALFFISFAWTLHTFSKNFIVDPIFSNFLSHKTFSINQDIWFIVLRLHIVLALVSLFIGPFGFVYKIRKKKINFHRISGKIYIASIVLNFVPSLYLAFYATGGLISTLGFILLDISWLIATWMAYMTIRKKIVQEHRKWMIRSYTLTLANTELYVLKTIFNSGLGINVEIAYQISIWLCLLLSLLMAELFIRRR